MSLSRCCAVVIGVSACGMVWADQQSVNPPPSKISQYAQAVQRGHQELYSEGWYIVTSTEKTLKFAKEHSITSSGQAVTRAVADARGHSAEFGKNLKEVGKGGVETSKQVFSGGTDLTVQELGLTAKAINTEWDYGTRNMSLAWGHLIKGNMNLAQRTATDRQALMALPGGWYKNLKSDFSNVYDLTEEAKRSMSTHIEGRWTEAFGEARAEFNQSYQQSGTRGNSLSGLGDIMAGYIKVLYSGLVKPATRSAAHGTELAAKGVASVVFLPVAGFFIVSGRTIESTGLSLYYATDMGIELVSPTVEGGLLTGLSLLSYTAIPVTAVAGSAAGAVNQVAIMAAAPVAGAGEAVAVGAGDTGVYAAQVSYDLFSGATKVTMNQAQSGIALGYNAITAVPAHLLLAGAEIGNGVIFLSFKGNHLEVASAKGEVQWSDKNGKKSSVPVGSLPVGSVVDLDTLRREPGVQVQIISDDPEVVQKVLEKLPDDLRVGEKP